MAGEILSTTLLEYLKRQYASWQVQDLLNLLHPALDFAAAEITSGIGLGGSGFFFPVRTRGSHPYAYISEGQALPAGGQSTIRQAVVAPTIFVGVIRIGGLAMAISAQDTMAFAKAFDENIEQTLRGMMSFKEGALFRDGSGLLATMVTDADGTVVEYTVDDVAYLEENMALDFIDASDGTRHATGVKVESIDWVNKKFTTATPLTADVDTGDLIYISGSQAATGAVVNKEPVGLAKSISATGTYLGIDRASEGNWRSSVLSTTGLPSEEHFTRLRTRIHQETGYSLAEMGTKFGCLTHPMQIDNLFRLSIPRVRYTAGEGFEQGHDGSFTFGGQKFYTSHKAPTTKIRMGDWGKHGSCFVPGHKLHIDSQFNGTQMKWRPDYDEAIVFAKEYGAFANLDPRCFGEIDGLSEQSR